MSGKDTAMAQKDSDLQKIKELIEIMKDNNLLEVEIKHGDDKIFLKRSQPQPAAGGMVAMVPTAGANTSAAPAGVRPIQALAAEEAAVLQTAPPDKISAPHEVLEIKSPIVGTFYATPSPDSEPYVEANSHVSEQTVVCIIEAMKVMNEIKAEVSGTIAEVLVTTGQAVEYGQVLFRVKPD